MAGAASLTDFEKRVVKALFAKNWRNQDIHAWINSGRNPTVNFARIAAVKKDGEQEKGTEEEVAFFMRHREARDGQTGLNPYDDERLVRAREAMILAVHTFNSPGVRFKTEVFCVLANVAWTYLMHEYYETKKGVSMTKPDGFTLALSDLIDRPDCPLSDGTKQNLKAIKVLRDEVEHHLLGKGDQKWLGYFQACCLNFDKAIRELFGDKLSLATDLAFALQFSRLNMGQATTLSKFEVPPHIEALDAKLTNGLNAAQIADLEFQFRVVYTLEPSSKTHAHIQFVKPGSEEGKQIHNVLAQKIAGDEFFPHKPTAVAKLVALAAQKAFTTNDHVKARKLHKIRPPKGAAQPGNTDRRYCLYHPAHNDYTYSDEWVAKLVEEVNDPVKLAEIRAVKL